MFYLFENKYRAIQHGAVVTDGDKGEKNKNVHKQRQQF